MEEEHLVMGWTKLRSVRRSPTTSEFIPSSIIMDWLAKKHILANVLVTAFGFTLDGPMLIWYARKAQLHNHYIVNRKCQVFF
jgi:hypothetical protein